MDTEFFNPARKYRGFRPRMAMRGRATLATSTNLATIALYNNSPGPYLLVVRDISLQSAASNAVMASSRQGQIGTLAGSQASLVSNEPLQAGQMWSIDTTQGYTGDYNLLIGTQGIFWWTHDFPFGVLIPGYSLVFQVSALAQALGVSVIWEAIEVDQLDYFY